MRDGANRHGRGGGSTCRRREKTNPLSGVGIQIETSPNAEGAGVRRSQQRTEKPRKRESNTYVSKRSSTGMGTAL